MGNSTSKSAISANCCPVQSGYDAILDIRSISEVNEDGWNVLLSNELHQRVVEYVNINGLGEGSKAFSDVLNFGASYTSVCVLGLFNKGKTFVVNRLANMMLPSNRKVHTKGLSFVKSKEEVQHSFFQRSFIHERSLSLLFDF